MLLYILALVIFLFLLFNILYFILPSLSPIPFFPTNRKDVSLVVSSLLRSSLTIKGNKTNNDQLITNNIIMDLGAGIGTVIFAAASFETATAKSDFAAPASSINLKNIQFRPPQSHLQPPRLQRLIHQPKVQFVAVEIHPLLVQIGRASCRERV